MLSLRRLAVALSLVGLVLFTGCRTYGGYGSEEATYSQMQAANAQFADQLERARADLEALQSAADTNAALQPLAERMDNMVDTHEDLLAEHEDLVASMTADDGYRALHKAYGTLVTESRLMRKQYDRVVRNVQATVRGTDLYTKPLSARSAYYVSPIGDPERAPASLTMEQALRSAAP